MLILASMLLATGARADAAAGKTYFQAQCSLCHSAEPADGGGGQGPALYGLFGSPAAVDKTFPYTQALRDSKLVWNAATLDDFLANPSRLAPNTTMVIMVPNAQDRADLIAYFETLKSKRP